MDVVESIKSVLGLEPHPIEGGFFVETYRSDLQMPRESLPAAYRAQRDAATAIYYLLTGGAFSELHRLPGDEIFHFYLGDPVEMLQLWPDGTGHVATLGSDVVGGMEPQVVVPGGVWQGARLVTGGAFALLGTTMTPGFDYADYERGDRRALQEAYPSFRDLIQALTNA
jgi:predicted cupin superfamily sugar epimerase